jgi:CelD/BcsL family acetyltransferase involved in cellulose biosynthesis
MRLELLPASERAEAARLWTELERQLPRRRLMSSWDWIETWLNHYGDLVPHRFALGHDDGVPVGLGLVTEETVRRGPVRVRTLHLGTVGEPPGETVYACYNALLALPAQSRRFADTLARRLWSARRWDALAIDRFEPDDAEPLLAALGAVHTRSEQAATVDLRAADRHGGDVLATLRPRTRQQVRRSLRALGAVQIEIAEHRDAADDILDDLIALHQRRWRAQGAPGVFASRRFTAFQRALIQRLLPQGRVMLFRAATDAGTLGCIYNLLEDGHVMSYLQGLAMTTDAKIKPGFVSHALCMQACFDRGLTEYDLLPEARGYKLELSNGTRDLVSGRVQRPRAKLALLATARRARAYAWSVRA